MAARFAEHPEAVAETVRLAERLTFDLTEDLGYRYPGSEDDSADGELARVCADLLAERYAGDPRRAEAETRLGQELATIRGLGLSGFFLLHRDMLELARDVALEVRGPDSARSVLPPGAAAAPASARSSATSPASPTSTRSPPTSSPAASSTTKPNRCRTSTSTSPATSARS